MHKYTKAETPSEKRQMVKILAELNDVSVPVMTAHIAALKVDAEPKAEVKERGSKPEAQDQNKAAGFTDAIPRRPLPGLNDKTELNKYILDAVRVRMEDVGNMVESYEREIAQLKETHAEYLEEWGALKEWLTANE